MNVCELFSAKITFLLLNRDTPGVSNKLHFFVKKNKKTKTGTRINMSNNILPDLSSHLSSGYWWPRLLLSGSQSHPEMNRSNISIIFYFQSSSEQQSKRSAPCQAGGWSWEPALHQWQPAPVAGCLLWCWTGTTLPPTGQGVQIQE